MTKPLSMPLLLTPPLTLPQPAGAKAPCFRGHVRKLLSPNGETCWMSEVRTPARHTALGLSPSASAALALAIAAVAVQRPLEIPVPAPGLRQAA